MNTLNNGHDRMLFSAESLQQRCFTIPPSYSASNLATNSGATETITSKPLPDLPADAPAFDIPFVDKFYPKSLAHAITSCSDEETLAPRDNPKCSSWLQRLYILIVDWWLWELISWTLSALCLVGVATLLGYYENRTLPSRWPGGISLNTAIAVLSGIAKYAMSVPLDSTLGQLKWRWFRSGQPRKLIDLELFDDATRGPWGALCLLWRLKGRDLASISAIIMILTLAFEPFFQQVVAYPSRLGAFGNTPLTRSITFKTKDVVVYADGNSSIVADNKMRVGVSSAFGGGPGPVQSNFSTSCASANCQWPPFQTLGICSQCHDISDLLTFDCLLEAGEWLSNRETPNAGSYPIKNATRIRSCGWYLNATSPDPVLMSGYELKNGTMPAQPGEALFGRTLPLFVAESNETLWDRSYHFRKEIETLPLHSLMLAINKEVGPVYANATPLAAECLLRWCVKTIEASVVDHQYSENITHIFTNDTYFGPPRVHYSPMTDEWTNQAEDIYIKPPGQNDTYYVREDIVFSTGGPLSWYIPAYWTAKNASSMTIVRTQNLLTLNATVPTTFITKYNTAAWSDLKSAAEYIDGWATAMTNVIRSYPNSSVPVMGFSGGEIYIRIQWGWLCVPLVMLTLCLVILVVTINSGPTRQEGGIWKSSSLAVQVHGMDPDMREAFGSAWSMHTMRAKANGMQVQMTTNAAGLQFVTYCGSKDMLDPTSTP